MISHYENMLFQHWKQLFNMRLNLLSAGLLAYVTTAQTSKDRSIAQYNIYKWKIHSHKRTPKSCKIKGNNHIIMVSREWVVMGVVQLLLLHNSSSKCSGLKIETIILLVLVASVGQEFERGSPGWFWLGDFHAVGAQLELRQVPAAAGSWLGISLLLASGLLHMG